MKNERLLSLRNQMKEAGVHCMVIPTSDYHNSEYVSDFFMARKYFSGFTGSAGTLVVTLDEAALFTDGRYFIQAAKELEGSGITLMKMGEPGVPTMTEYVDQKLQQGWTLCFDGRVITSSKGSELEEIAKKHAGQVRFDLDLCDAAWENRPALIHHPVRILSEEYAGESAEEKLARVREEMKKEEAGIHVLASLDDIAWLYNIRSNDVECCPVVLAYTMVTKDRALLFAEEGFAAGEDISARERMEKAGVEIYPYDRFYEMLGSVAAQATKEEKASRVWIDESQVNFRVLKELQKICAEEGAQAGTKLLNKENPTTLMKSIKNETELKHTRRAHIKDAVAVTKFMYWLKKNIGSIPMDEVSVAEKIDGLRAQQEGFIELSFPTISAYGTNGAIIHYGAQKETCAALKPEGMLMIDSGGHYIDGTTDITRTFILGPVTPEMKKHYTLVLRAMLSMRATRFLHGCTGANLDIRAREVLWEHGLDYKHGTGHGVGNILNVHEGPQSFRWKLLPDARKPAVFEEGMITSDEPGIYLENQYGIRIENEILCRKGEENEYGQFMYFEDLTFVPIDLDGVELSQMSELDKERLNDYHAAVFEKLKPYFEGEELTWLRHVTRAV
ncbi:MAG: aminopeptidase P family protein [Lachnospiraceae bacterium]|nr:aminopeptidase P family protein [Lachnospiraceae bacterium]